LLKDKKKLDIEKKNLENEREKIREFNKIQAGKIKLNVGGTYFTTSVSSLIREQDSILARLCTSQFQPSADDGAYFLDRDPELFKPILNYLRTGKLNIPPEISKESILEEAKFMMLDGLVNIIQPKKEIANTQREKKALQYIHKMYADGIAKKKEENKKNLEAKIKRAEDLFDALVPVIKPSLEIAASKGLSECSINVLNTYINIKENSFYCYSEHLREMVEVLNEVDGFRMKVNNFNNYLDISWN